MNYFLILGIIVMVTVFLGLLLNNLSKIVQQSEQKDVLFTLLFLILDMLIFIIFSISVSSLQKDYNKSIETTSFSYIIDLNIQAKTDKYWTIKVDNHLINVQITNDTQFINDKNYGNKIKITKTELHAPNVWYMMDWEVEALNNTILYTADIIYQNSN